MIYPPNQKPPIWSIDPGIIAYNCQKAGMPHPVLAMPMWEGAGNHALDYSGRGNHGTFTNNPAWVADGIECDLSNESYITISDVADSFDTCSAISIFVDLHWVASDEYGRLVDKGYANGAYQLYQYGAGGNIGFYMYGIVGDTDTGVPLEGRNQWCFVYDGSSAKIYKNGNLVHTSAGLSGDIPNHANPLYFLGGGADSTTGTIYSAEVFRNVAISAAQIKFLSDNPYFMYRLPEELYGYVAGAPPPASIINQFMKSNLGSNLYNGVFQ